MAHILFKFINITTSSFQFCLIIIEAHTGLKTSIIHQKKMQHVYSIFNSHKF